MADKIKVLLKGEEVEEAATEVMMKTPKEEYTESLWAVSHQRKQKSRPKNSEAFYQYNPDAAYSNGPRVGSVSFDILKAQLSQLWESQDQENQQQPDASLGYFSFYW